MMDGSGLCVSGWTFLTAKLTTTVLMALEKYVVIKLRRYEVKYTAPWGRQGTSFNTAVAGELSTHISVKLGAWGRVVVKALRF